MLLWIQLWQSQCDQGVDRSSRSRTEQPELDKVARTGSNSGAGQSNVQIRAGHGEFPGTQPGAPDQKQIVGLRKIVYGAKGNRGQEAT